MYYIKYYIDADNKVSSVSCSMSTRNENNNSRPTWRSSTAVLADSGESGLELFADAAVDEKVWGEVQHDEKIGQGLQTHHPEGRDIHNTCLVATILHVCK